MNWVEFLCSCPLPQPSNFWENTIPTKSKRSTLPYNSLPQQEFIYYLYQSKSTKFRKTQAVGCFSPVAPLEIHAGVTWLELPPKSCWRGVWVLSDALFCHWSLPWLWDRRRVHPPAFQEPKMTIIAATDSITPGISESRKPQFSCLEVFLACLYFY